jgi:CheY-like chemotaxis protein
MSYYGESLQRRNRIGYVARTHRPDLIALDVLLGGIDGLTALSRLRANRLLAAIPVAMITVTGEKNRVFEFGAVI